MDVLFYSRNDEFQRDGRYRPSGLSLFTHFWLWLDSDIFGDEHQNFKDAHVFAPRAEGLQYGDPCFVAGKLHINAGIIIDSIPRAETDKMYFSAWASCTWKGIYQGFYFDIQRTEEIRPDRLAIPTLAVLPKVLNAIGMKNATQISIWNNVDTYIGILPVTSEDPPDQ